MGSKLCDSWNRSLVLLFRGRLLLEVFKQNWLKWLALVSGTSVETDRAYVGGFSPSEH